MKKLFTVRSIVLAGSLLLQVSSPCFHARAAANDSFAESQVISGSFGTTTGSNVGATKEPGEPDHADVAGSNSVWFRWIAPASGQFSFNTAGSDFDTVLAVYTGANVNALTQVASNDDSDTDLTSAVSFAATNGTTYFVAVDGYDGAVGALVLNWLPVTNDSTVAREMTFRTLHSFTNGADGMNPQAELLLSDNTLYGTTKTGGNPGAGTVFTVNTDGMGFTILHSFTGGSDGANPYAGLILSGNTLYGTTRAGGSSGYGTVFAVNTNGTGFTKLHNFSATSGSFSTNSDGALPHARLILSGNTLYGTATSGGHSGKGTVFAVGIDGTGFTNLHSFTATSVTASTNSDGATPYAGLVLSGNTLYGAAINGGSSGYGTLFAVNTNGTGFTTLHSFNWSNGAYPRGLVLSGNTLYGTGNGGGSSGSGSLFAINTGGTGFTNLHSFIGVSGPLNTNRYGSNPFGVVFLSGNTVYGTALGGGSSGKGTVFAVSTNGTGLTSLHSFSATVGPALTNNDGASPRSGIVLSGTAFYGTTDRGGSSGYGTVFSLSLLPPHMTIIPSGANVILTWPVHAAGFTPQSTTNLALPNAWSPVGQPSVTNAGQISVTVPTTVGEKFFRLKSQ